jgi:hypothetical protein
LAGTAPAFDQRARRADQRRFASIGEKRKWWTH